MYNKRKDNMTIKVKSKDVWLIVKRTFWDSDQDNWFDVSEIANTPETAESKKAALETLNSDNKVSYLIIQSKRLEKKESEESDEIRF
jgi:hypothetical protein